MLSTSNAIAYALAGGLVLAADCAHEVIRQPAALMANTASKVFEVRQDVEIVLDSGYGRRLTRGSRWAQAGKLPQGDAYKAVGGVFTVEGAHVHEAWPVVSAGEVVGFYLPVERAFTPLAKPARIEFKPVSP